MRTFAKASSLVSRDDVCGRKRCIGRIRCCKGPCQFRLEAFEGLLLGPFLVAADEIANVFAHVLVESRLTDIRGNVLLSAPLSRTVMVVVRDMGKSPLVLYSLSSKVHTLQGKTVGTGVRVNILRFSAYFVAKICCWGRRWVKPRTRYCIRSRRYTTGARKHGHYRVNCKVE